MDHYYEVSPGHYRKGSTGPIIPTDLGNRHYKQMISDTEAHVAEIEWYAGSDRELAALKENAQREVSNVFSEVSAENNMRVSLADMTVYDRIIAALPEIPEPLEKLAANSIVAAAAIAYIETIDDIEVLKDYDANVEPQWVR